MVIQDHTRQLIDFILDEFSSKYGSAIGIFEKEGTSIFSTLAITYFSPLCKYLHSKPLLKDICDNDHKRRSSLVSIDLCTHRCVWGLHNISVPVSIDSEYHGTILVGQRIKASDAIASQYDFDRCCQLNKDIIKHSNETTIRDKYNQVERVPDNFFNTLQEELEQRTKQLVFNVYFERRYLDHERADLEKRINNVAHEIQLYNQGALSASEKLADIIADNNLPSSVLSIANKIPGMLVHLGSVVTNLLWISSKFHYAFDRINILDVLTDTVNYYKWYADCKDININFKIGIGSPKVLCSRIHVEQVFNNLMHNAIKYSYYGKREVGRLRYVDVNAYIQGDFYCVSFSNYGIPILREEFDDIYGKYSRGKLVLDEKRTGTGIGLYIVKEIMDAHKGRIELSTKDLEGDAKVMTFIVKFPYNM